MIAVTIQVFGHHGLHFGLVQPLFSWVKKHVENVTSILLMLISQLEGLSMI
jgi:hypothetical protein